MRVKIYNKKSLPNILKLRKQGNIDELRKATVKMRKRLNERYRQIEKKGYSDNWFYQNETKHRYSESFTKLKKMGIKELTQYRLDIRRQLENEKTTIRCIKKYISKTDERLEKLAQRITEETGEKVAMNDLKKFFELTGNELTGAGLIDSDQVLYALADNINDNLTIEHFIRTFWQAYREKNPHKPFKKFELLDIIGDK